MTTTELIAKIQTELTGEIHADLQHLEDTAKKYRKEPNANELAAALAELAFTLLPEEQQKQMRRTTFVRDMRMDKAFHVALQYIQEDKLLDAEALLAEIAETIRVNFEEGDKKWFSFRNPFEYHVYRMYYPTVEAFERAPFDFAHYLTIYGYVLLENHKVQEAVQAVERGIRFNPVNADVRFELAEIFKFSYAADKLLKVNQETLRICSTAQRIARALCNMGYYCVMKEQFFDAAVFYFESLRFQYHKPVEFELQDVMRRMKMNGQTFVPPTHGQVLDAFEKYGMAPPPNSDLVNLAIALAEEARDLRQLELEGLFYRIAYDLTNEPKFKEFLTEIDEKLGHKKPDTVLPDAEQPEAGEHPASADQ